jgi:hypothetical protein
MHRVIVIEDPAALRLGLHDIRYGVPPPISIPSDERSQRHEKENE